MPRHPNGGGRLIEDGEVSAVAYLDRRSIVGGRARVRGGYIFNSTISGASFIAGAPDLTDCALNGAYLSGAPVLLRCALGVGVEVFDQASLQDVVLTGAIQVGGTAQLVGPWSLATGYGARIMSGTWTRAPRVHRFLRYPVTEAAGGAWIGCRYHSYAEWLDRYPAAARRMKWDEAEVQEMMSVLRGWRDAPSAR